MKIKRIDMKIISQAFLYATVALSSLNAASLSSEDLSPVRSASSSVGSLVRVVIPGEGAAAVPTTPLRLPASFPIFSPELLIRGAPASSALGLTPLLERYEPRYPGYKGGAAAENSLPSRSGDFSLTFDGKDEKASQTSLPVSRVLFEDAALFSGEEKEASTHFYEKKAFPMRDVSRLTSSSSGNQSRYYTRRGSVVDYAALHKGDGF